MHADAKRAKQGFAVLGWVVWKESRPLVISSDHKDRAERELLEDKELVRRDY